MDKYICVDDSKTPASKHFTQWVVEGDVYTIRRKEGSLTGEVRVLLNEIKNEPVFIAEFGGKVEPGFNIKRLALLDDAMNIVEEKKITEKVPQLILS